MSGVGVCVGKVGNARLAARTGVVTEAASLVLLLLLAVMGAADGIDADFVLELLGCLSANDWPVSTV